MAADEHLFNLRLESHKAASEYHRAIEEWETVSRSQEAGGKLDASLQRYRDIAANYHNALEALSAYLRTLEPTKLVTEEIKRTLKLQELLDREIKLIF
jgi:hypothetical protein